MLLYRFIDLAGFIDIVTSRRMYLRQVTAWADPYETGALRYLVHEVLEETDLAVVDPTPGKSAKVTELRKAIRDAIVDHTMQSIYAQSWTILPESDALWRIYSYSPDRRGIRISVRRDDIWIAMKGTLPNVDHFEVDYCSAEDARTRVRDRFRNSSSRIGITSCCRYKRNEFSHEQEYRFCMFQPPKGYRGIDLTAFDFNDEQDLEKALGQFYGFRHDEFKYYPFDPALIQEVTLDPRLDPVKDGWYVEAILNLCEAQEIGAPVRRSGLYTWMSEP